MDMMGDLPENGAVLDQRQALERLDGDTDLLRQISDVFVLDAPAKLDSIRRALSEGRTETAERLAHSFKGNCGTVGALECEAVARALEEALAQGRTGEAKALLERACCCLEALLPLFAT